MAPSIVPSVAKKNGKTKSETDVFSMIFGRTNLIIGPYKAKKCEESAGDVRFDVAPRKPSKNMEKRVFGTEKNLKKFWRRKMKCRESPKTRFAEV